MPGPYYQNDLLDGDIVRALQLEEIEAGFLNVDTDKANKVEPSAAGNLPTLSVEGDLVDSGKQLPSGELLGDNDDQVVSNKTIGAGNKLADNTGDHFYTINTSELTADRVITVPVLTGNDTFVFAGHNNIFAGQNAHNGKESFNGEAVFSGPVTYSAVSEDGAIDCSAGNYFYDTVSSNTTYSFSNIPDGVYIFCVEVSATTAVSLSWPVNVSWTKAAAPIQTPSGTDIYWFRTRDGGSTIAGVRSLENV